MKKKEAADAVAAGDRTSAAVARGRTSGVAAAGSAAGAGPRAEAGAKREAEAGAGARAAVEAGAGAKVGAGPRTGTGAGAGAEKGPQTGTGPTADVTQSPPDSPEGTESGQDANHPEHADCGQGADRPEGTDGAEGSASGQGAAGADGADGRATYAPTVMAELPVRVRPCSLAAALEIVGERWSLLALREMAYGVHRFAKIAGFTGASRDILADRLRKLEEAGVIERRRYSEHPPRYEYHLTEAGRELFPVTVGLMRWGDKWAVDSPSVVFRHTCGEPLVLELRCAHCGEPVTRESLTPTRRQEPAHPH